MHLGRSSDFVTPRNLRCTSDFHMTNKLNWKAKFKTSFVDSFAFNFMALDRH